MFLVLAYSGINFKHDYKNINNYQMPTSTTVEVENLKIVYHLRQRHFSRI